jgi:hypothetical protein
MGTLLFDDDAFCCQFQTLLESHCRQAIADIGRLDISHLL